MRAAPVTEAPSLAPRAAGRIAVASFVGTTLESFDFYVFAYFSAVFAPAVFFPTEDRAAGTISAFTVLALSYLVRPIGAVIFGHLGDRLGRRRTLLVTVAVMGLATGVIGLLPSYAAIGLAAPLALAALRVVQGLSLGGEWGGAVLIAVEHAAPRRRAFAAALPQLGSPVGTVMTGALFLVLSATLSPADLVAWGWRIPFLVAFPLLAISLWIRRSIDETPVFASLVERRARDRMPVLDVLRRRPLALLVAIGAAMLGVGSYALLNTYTTSYGVTVLGFPYQAIFAATLIGSVLELAVILFFGRLATRIGSTRVVAAGAAGTLILAVPLYAVLQTATFPVLVGVMLVGGVLPSMSWAALGGLMADLFEGPVRYSALSIAYAVAAAVSGLVPVLTAALGTATHEAWWHPAIVLSVLSVVTLVAAIAAHRMRHAADLVTGDAARTDLEPAGARVAGGR